MCKRKLRIENDGVLEHLQREFEILPDETSRVALAAKIEIVRLQIRRRLHRQRLLFFRRQSDPQGLRNPARDLVLQLEDILHFAVVSLGPNREISLRVDELRVNS